MALAQARSIGNEISGDTRRARGARCPGISGMNGDWASVRQRCVAEAARIVRRAEDAEEVAQEALARAWRSRASCRTPENPLPWCLQITRNEAFRLLARQRGEPLPESLPGDDALES